MPKQHIRQALREQRRKLTPYQQRQAGNSLARHLSHQPFFLRARHLALYLPNDGELDPTLLLSRAVAAGKSTYLPVLDPMQQGKLCFLPWQPGMPLVNNRFGIPEPAYRPQRQLKPWQLDIIFMPLVGFDEQGNRLGMGGGFYDKTLGHRAGANTRHPLLIGLAHEFQQQDQLPSDPWDVPLHAIATDTKMYFTHNYSAADMRT